MFGPRKKSETTELAHGVLRRITRAYYSDQHVAVMDAFLSMEEGKGALSSVKEVDLQAAVRLGTAQTREILTKFQVDQLLTRTVVKEKEKEVEDIGKTIKGRELLTKVFSNRNHEFLWQLNPERVVRTVRYRHTKILEKLDNKVDEARGQLYDCPNPRHPEHDKGPFSIFDLLADRDPAAVDQSFRCRHCKAKNKKGMIVHLPLRARKQDGPDKDLKAKFNQQIKPITELVQKLGAAIKEEREAAAEQLRKEDEPEDESMSVSQNRKAEEEKLKQDTQTERQTLNAKLAAKDHISVSFADNNHRVSEEPPGKKMKLDALPWDVKGQEEAEAERREEEERRQHSLAKEQLERQQLDLQSFRDKKAEWAQKLETSATLAVETLAAEPEELNVTLFINGVKTTCNLSSISVEQAGEMTEAEFDAYNALLQKHNTADDFDDFYVF